jgi:hypothetical protein
LRIVSEVQLPIALIASPIAFKATPMRISPAAVSGSVGGIMLTPRAIPASASTMANNALGEIRHVHAKPNCFMAAAMALSARPMRTSPAAVSGSVGGISFMAPATASSEPATPTMPLPISSQLMVANIFIAPARMATAVASRSGPPR